MVIWLTQGEVLLENIITKTHILLFILKGKETTDEFVLNSTTTDSATYC